MSRYHFVFLLLFFAPPAFSEWSSSDTLRVKGSFWDASTGHNLPGEIMAKVRGEVQDKEVKIGTSGSDGKFNIIIPSNATYLYFKTAGYKVSPIVIQKIGQVKSKEDFQILVPVIKNDSFQIVQSYSLAPKAEQPDNENTSFFEVLDAENRFKIKAKICFSLPDSKNPICIETDTSEAVPFINFDNSLNWTVSINADGYEYNSVVLIKTKIPGKPLLYQFRLVEQKQELAMSLQLKEMAVKEFKVQRTDLKMGGMWGPGKIVESPYFTIRVRSGSYIVSLVMKDGRILKTKPFDIWEGINFLGLDKSDFEAESLEQENDLLPVMKVVNLKQRTLYFDQSSYVLKPSNKAELELVATYLKSNPDLIIQVNGYSDGVGDKQKNMLLSEYRCRVVKTYLTQRGVQQKQIQLFWFGDERQLEENEPGSSLTRNRRVEILLK